MVKPPETKKQLNGLIAKERIGSFNSRFYCIGLSHFRVDLEMITSRQHVGFLLIFIISPILTANIFTKIVQHTRCFQFVVYILTEYYIWQFAI